MHGGHDASATTKSQEERNATATTVDRGYDHRDHCDHRDGRAGSESSCDGAGGVDCNYFPGHCSPLRSGRGRCRPGLAPPRRVG
eukprot:8026719-Lingulodinium_polyedra.AAC.1